MKSYSVFCIILILISTQVWAKTRQRLKRTFLLSNHKNELISITKRQLQAVVAAPIATTPVTTPAATTTVPAATTPPVVATTPVATTPPVVATTPVATTPPVIATTPVATTPVTATPAVTPAVTTTPAVTPTAATTPIATTATTVPVVATTATTPALTTPAAATTLATPAIIATTDLGDDDDDCTDSKNTHVGWLGYICASLMVLMGLPIAFKGLQWWRFCAIPLGVLAGLQLTDYYKDAIMQNQSDTTGWELFWLIVAVCLGTALALMFYFCIRWAACLAVGYMTFTLGCVIVATVNAFLNPDMPFSIGVIIVTCCYGGGFVLGIFFPDTFILIGSAIAGSYNFVGGIGKFIGVWPQNKHICWGTWYKYIFLTCFAIIIVLGWLYQSHERRKDEENEDETSNVSVEIEIEEEVSN